MQSVFITREDLALIIRSLGDQPQPPIDDAILPAERQMISRRTQAGFVKSANKNCEARMDREDCSFRVALHCPSDRPPDTR